jgi:hypothetical protein
VEAGTVASGAHRNCARAGDHASAHSGPPRHGSRLRLIEDSAKVSEYKLKAYMNLTAKGDSGKGRRCVTASVWIDNGVTVA